MARPSLLLLAAASLSAAAGCVDTDATVFVDATIREPSMIVDLGSLGAGINGAFDLSLALGPRASGASQVSLRSLSITNEDQSVTIVSSIGVNSETPFPVEVAPDQELVVELSFSSGADTLPSDVGAQLCGQQAIRLAGTIQDSLQDGATPVVSESFFPLCAGPGP